MGVSLTEVRIFLVTERDRNGPHLLESALTKAPPSIGMVEFFLDLEQIPTCNHVIARSPARGQVGKPVSNMAGERRGNLCC